MKILLIRDVPKLGRAGDVKKVAEGYGRNFLIPHGMAVLATPGALKQAEKIRSRADEQRAILNKEMAKIAEILAGKTISFAMRASEVGRLYGSVTTRMISETLNQKYGVELSHRQVECEPLRLLGTFKVPLRLTIDLVPDVTVIVHREGEAVSQASVTPVVEAAPMVEEVVAEVEAAAEIAPEEAA